MNKNKDFAISHYKFYSPSPSFFAFHTYTIDLKGATVLYFIYVNNILLSCHWITSVSICMFPNNGPKVFLFNWIFQEGGNSHSF